MRDTLLLLPERTRVTGVNRRGKRKMEEETRRTGKPGKVAHLWWATAANIIAGKKGAQTSQYLQRKTGDSARDRRGWLQEGVKGSGVPFFAVCVEQDKEHNNSN